MKEVKKDEFKIILPTKGKGIKELKNLLIRRKPQTLKAIEKLKRNPTDYRLKGIEKINSEDLGQYTIRVSSGDRIFYDVDPKNKIVYILRAGKHDLYKLI